MREKGRSFLLGFVPTLCVWGLIAGLLTVWVNTQSVLTPETPLLIPRSVRLAAWGIEKGMERLPEGWRQELEGALFG